MPDLLLLSIWTIDALLKLTPFSDPQIRPDGKMYAYVRQGNVYQAPIDGQCHLLCAAKSHWIG